MTYSKRRNARKREKALAKSRGFRAGSILKQLRGIRTTSVGWRKGISNRGYN